jgi:hypothetical protein
MNEVYHAVDPSETSANVGDAVAEQTAVQIVHQAVDGDISFSTTAGSTTAANRKTGWAEVPKTFPPA